MPSKFVLRQLSLSKKMKATIIDFTDVANKLVPYCPTYVGYPPREMDRKHKSQTQQL